MRAILLPETSMQPRPRRLLVLCTLILLVVPLAAAQQTATIPRLCSLALYPIAESPVIAGRSPYDAFLRGLRDGGYVEGQSITTRGCSRMPGGSWPMG